MKHQPENAPCGDPTCTVCNSRTPTETVEGWRERFENGFGQLWFIDAWDEKETDETERLLTFIQSELDLALTKERARVNEVLEDLKNNTKAMSKTNEKAVEQTKGYLQALSDAQKRITDNT